MRGRECTMNYYFAFSVLLTVIYNCDGGSYNTPILSGILSGAHNVGSDVQAALQGLAQGIDLNFQGSLDNNRGQYQYGYQKPRPQTDNGAYNKPNPPAETIIVIVEEEAQPQQNNYGQRPQRPQQNHWDGRPGQNNNFNQPNYLNKPGYNYGYNSNNYGHNHNYQHRPHHHHNTPEYNNNPHEHYNNNYDDNYNPNNNGANHYGDTQPSEKPDQYNKPPKEVATEAPKAKPDHGHDKKLTTTTKQPDEDKPFFVPLSADQYTYGGEKIEINAPKRETNENNKPTYDDAADETFPIDVRINKEP